MRVLKLASLGLLAVAISACTSISPQASPSFVTPVTPLPAVSAAPSVAVPSVPSVPATAEPPTIGPASPTATAEPLPTEQPSPIPSSTPKPTKKPTPTPSPTPTPIAVDLAIYVNTPDLPTEWHVNTDYTIPINVTADVNDVPGVQVKVSIPEEAFSTTYLTNPITAGGTDTHKVTINVTAMGPATLTLFVRTPDGYADINKTNNKVTISINVLP